MPGLESMFGSYSGLELVDYQISQEAICVDVSFCSDVICSTLCETVCTIGGGGGGRCDGTTCCCDCL